MCLLYLTKVAADNILSWQPFSDELCKKTLQVISLKRKYFDFRNDAIKNRILLARDLNIQIYENTILK